MSDYDGIEVPWGPEPVPARLSVGELRQSVAEKAAHGRRSTLRLHFIDPKTGREVDIAVTRGERPSTAGEHTWHIEIAGDRVTVNPSVHFVGHFHSGNPAHFRLGGNPR